MRLWLPLMINVLIPPAKNVFLYLAVTAATSATDAAIEKKIYGSGLTVKALEESSLLTEGFTKTIKNQAKEKKS